MKRTDKYEYKENLKMEPMLRHPLTKLRRAFRTEIICKDVSHLGMVKYLTRKVSKELEEDGAKRPFKVHIQRDGNAYIGYAEEAEEV